jgi:uncharacterized protein involved in exopolysaccharide biosynthesis
MTPLPTRSNHYQTTQGLTLRDVVMPVFRHRRMTTLIFVGIFFGAVLAVLLLPRKYEAEMKLLMNKDRVDAVVTPNPNAPIGAQSSPAIGDEDINSEVELLKSRDLLEQVVIACGLDTQPETKLEQLVGRVGNFLRVTPSTPEARLARSVQTLENRLVVDPLKKTTVIRVSYTSRDAALSARVLETLATLYQEKHAAVHRPAGTFQFFEQESARYRDELAAAEAELTEFNSQAKIISGVAQKQLVLQQLSQFEAELLQTQASAGEAGTRAAALKAEAKRTPERQTTQERKIDNAQLLAALEASLLSLELKRSEMTMKYAPEYPPVVEVEKQIAEARRAIATTRESPLQDITTDRVPAQDWMATELAKAETDRAALEARATSAARAVNHYERAAQTLDALGVKQDDLARNVKTAEDNYLLYLHKREEARISDALDSKRIVNVSIAEAATIPALPTLHLPWVLLGAFFAATVLSTGSAYAVDRLDPSFRTPDELGRYLDLKVLASIPENAKERP